MAQSRTFIYIYLSCTILFWCSCKKVFQTSESGKPDRFVSLYDTFWREMNRNYIYWDIDTTNWDEIYPIYREKFALLEFSKREDVKKSVQLFREMTSGLVDGHLSIFFTHPDIRDSSVNPSFIGKAKEIGFYYPYSYFQVDTSYLDKNFKLGFDNKFSTNGVPLTVLSGMINSNIIYFGFNAFDLQKSYYSNYGTSVRPVVDFFFENLLKASNNTKGVILDVRSNFGGDLPDLKFIMGRLIGKPEMFGFQQSKLTDNRLDFTPWIESWIYPSLQSTIVSEIPLVILGDRNSASLSEVVIFISKVRGKSYFIGEKTWGATGPIVDNNIFSSGSFEVSNFLKVQASSVRFKYIDHLIYEGRGIDPDIEVKFDLASLRRGVDPVLMKAIQLLR